MSHYCSTLLCDLVFGLRCANYFSISFLSSARCEQRAVAVAEHQNLYKAAQACTRQSTFKNFRQNWHTKVNADREWKMITHTHTKTKSHNNGFNILCISNTWVVNKTFYWTPSFKFNSREFCFRRAILCNHRYRRPKNVQPYLNNYFSQPMWNKFYLLWDKLPCL